MGFLKYTVFAINITFLDIEITHVVKIGQRSLEEYGVFVKVSRPLYRVYY